MKSNTPFSPLITALVEALTLFPGVGTKSAQRMALHVLKEKNRNRCHALGELLIETSHKIRHCDQCNILSETRICTLCSHTKRDQTILCVVESPADVLAIEQSASYHGQYFVLMGALSPLDGIGPEELKIHLLLNRLKAGQFEEVILATNATVEGETTADYLSSLIKPMQIKTTRIAYGVPIGSALEYIDGNTLEKALRHRSSLDKIYET